MSDERPEALLKSALEKIVYFEARAGSLSSDLGSLRAEVDRLKAELATASQREIELRRELAEREVRLQRAHSEREELGRIQEALRQERAQLIGRLLEASQIHRAGSPDDLEGPFDLASFIAQLRGEVLDRADAPAERRPPAASDAPARAPGEAHPGALQHAQRLAAEGRLLVSEKDLAELSSGRPFAGRSEETLFGFSVRELSAPDPAARGRAAERLKVLAHPASAPALATALNGEREPVVQIALLDAFALVAREEGAAIVSPLLASPRPDVRVAALKALMKIAPEAAAPQLSAAMKDPDRAVRRRASLLALGLEGGAALRLGEEALSDQDSDVRSVGALVLGASSGERARQLLLRALRDRDTKVRMSAAQSLSRIVGEDVSEVVALDDAQRRREIRRIQALPVRPVLAALQPRPALELDGPGRGRSSAAARAPAARGGVAAVVAPSAKVAVATLQRSSPAPAARVAIATVEQAPAIAQVKAAELPPRVVSEALCGQLATEVRCAIRGKTVAELARGASTDEATVVEACELLVARGALVRRGTKFFAA